MIRVGFIGHHFASWMGGIHYYKNLLYALSRGGAEEIEPIVFVGKTTDAKLVEMFRPHARVVHDPMFDKRTASWVLSKICSHVLHSPFMLNRLLKKHQIDVLSHANVTLSGLICRTISWIPDFQHLHLPDMFDAEQLRQRDVSMRELLRASDGIILSSNDAFEDARDFEPAAEPRLYILQFVSQPSRHEHVLTPEMAGLVRRKYDLPERFFHLPNQFWRHKNHMQVFHAIRDLKSAGIDVSVVCTGLMSDYRSPDHIDNVNRFLEENDLRDNIYLLGLIDYEDMQVLMRYSVAVLNPSLFEGWSSTVEECKSIGKNLVLSNIPVHVEQNPPASLYFDPRDTASLAEALKEAWISERKIPDLELEAAASASLDARTRNFASTYQKIVQSVSSA